MDLSEYWKNRGKTFSQEISNQPSYVQKYLRNQESHILKILSSTTFENILEIGCGTGRLTKLISELPLIKKYLAIDISPDLISVAQKEIHNPNIVFQCVDILEFQTQEKFDLVFSCEVIQHIEPSKIDSVISKLTSFSKQKLIFVESYDPDQIGYSKDDYFFIHDYKKIFLRLDLNFNIKKIPLPLSLKFMDKYIKMRNRRSFGKQAIFEITL